VEKPAFERPGPALEALLREHGIDRIAILSPVNRRRLIRLGLQQAAVAMLVDELDVCELEEPIECRMLWEGEHVGVGVPGRGGVRCVFAAGTGRRCGRRIFGWGDLRRLLPDPPFPSFIVDLSLRFIHFEDELRSLKVQLGVSLSVVREWLWDPHLAVTSATPTTREWLYDVVGDSKMRIYQERPGRVLWSMGADRVVILRPDADEPLTEEDVREAQAFLIGGVVDRIPRPGVSRILDSMVPWGVPRRLELRGSLIGVPERINRIIEILLKARYAGMSVEEAIVSSMTVKDVMARLHVEIARATRGGRLPAGDDLYESLASWLPVDCRLFRLAASKVGARVQGGCAEG